MFASRLYLHFRNEVVLTLQYSLTESGFVAPKKMYHWQCCMQTSQAMAYLCLSWWAARQCEMVCVTFHSSCGYKAVVTRP